MYKDLRYIFKVFKSEFAIFQLSVYKFVIDYLAHYFINFRSLRLRNYPRSRFNRIRQKDNRRLS